MRTVLILNTVLLAGSDVFLAVAISRCAGIGSRVRNLLKIPEAHKKVMLTANAFGSQNSHNGLKILERMELAYIDKSNIRHYIPFMNIYMLIVVIIALFLLALNPVYGLLHFLPSSVVIAAIISMVPLFALDLLARYNSEVIRKSLAEYVSVLNRWCSVKEDIMYAFEKSLDSSIGEPLRTFIRDMVIQVNRGMEPTEALDMLQLKVDNPQFRDFILNIKMSMKHRGDIIKLLTNLEEQFYRIDEEYTRRSISTYKDRLLIYFIMFAVLAVAYFFINFTPQIHSFYLQSTDGKLLLTLFCGMYVLGFYLTAGITKFKH
jgi:Flp pilus assembly protein TadB